ncbi:hypothetical protein EDWATA_01406 [Edwardsiella tarda ATCC 23685]|uniref:Uncharacterized protein n=1 Tax=Edwardsiella tarda ATCC 23685 TaxID=500638 RepID=D4F3U1_EDWTA|nr:hypothetical protein EDWATA_01406 [Edwardsiella tarda ATCC 23685]
MAAGKSGKCRVYSHHDRFARPLRRCIDGLAATSVKKSSITD